MRKAAPLAGPAIVTAERKRVLVPTDAKKLEAASAVVRKAKPCNDNRPDVVPPVAVVRPAKPSRAEDNPKPATTTTSRKQPAAEGPHLPIKLPLSCKPVDRAGGDYKAMKAAMADRLRKRP
jgi:hypothetical protein